MVGENHFSCSHYDKKGGKELELFKIFDFNRSFRIYEVEGIRSHAIP